MSINVSSSLLDVSSSLVLTIDTDKLGPRQVIALERSVRTGITNGTGVPAQVARKVRGGYGLPRLHTRNGYVHWDNVGPNEDNFFDVMLAMCAASALGGDGASSARTKYLEGVQQAALDKHSRYNGWLYLTPKLLARMAKTVVFSSNPLTDWKMPRSIEIDLSKDYA